MPSRDPRVPLIDILDAVLRIERYVQGLSEAEYQENEMVQDAVARCIEIISEASRRVPSDLKQAQPSVPWDKVAGIGIIFRHDYDEIDTTLVWEIVRVELPALRNAVEAMLKSLPPKA